MLTKEETNDYGHQFWKLEVPEEHCEPGLEITIHTTSQGLSIGDGVISWDELESAKKELEI
ncbi:MAG: hypothetical protein GY941_26405 [Planctomycetes bacterium]|nr:hypothetical protein [Planctomycetota bacterium]